MNFSMFRAKGLWTFASLLVCSLILFGSAFAQSGTTGLSGTVVDQAGAAVPGMGARGCGRQTSWSAP